MKRLLLGGFALAVVLASAGPARAQAWPVKHKWSDQARPGDATSGSFAYEYAAGSVALAGSMTTAGVKFDCADFAITILCEYGARNGLEVSFVFPDPAAPQWATHPVSSTESRFHSVDQFAKFSRDWINAKMVAQLNATVIDPKDLRGGDIYSLRWNQLGDANPFPGRDVWHTYFVGDPDKLLFYGNEDGANPLAIEATMESFRLDEVKGQAVYEGAPRRWNIIKDAIVPPVVPIQKAPPPEFPQEATVKSNLLNVRSTPGGTGKIVRAVPKGTKLSVEGQTPWGWVRVRLDDGTIAYVFGQYVSIAASKPTYDISGAPSRTDGIAGAINSP